MDELITWAMWRELEREPVGYGHLNAHRLRPGVSVLAIDHRGHRHVLLPVASLTDGLTDTRSRGVTITTRQLEVEGEPEHPFVDVCCVDPDGFVAFDLLATQIREASDAGAAAVDAVGVTVARWRRFWGAGPPEGLRPEEIRGLFGELWFLLVWLLPHGSREVERWAGPAGARDDFQWPAFSIEAKTTTSIRGHIHRINGVDQLDPPTDGRLLLFSLRLREEPAATNSLVTLVTSIGERLGADPARLDLFEERLAAAGYSPAHAERYAEVRFRVVSERLYRVEGDFPRLSPSLFVNGIPRGVETVDYEINLEGFPGLIAASDADHFAPPD